MRALLTKIAADLRRRRLQAGVVFVTALLAVGTGTMALTLLSQTRDPYQVAFKAQHGSHLQVAFDSSLDAQTTVSTAALIGAAAAGGPYASTDLQFQLGSHKLWITTIGRDDPGGQVEQLRVTGGHWPTTNNQIALTQSFMELNHIAIGDRLRVISVPQQPQLTVTAEVFDIDEGGADVNASACAAHRVACGEHSWVLSSAIAALSLKDASYSFMDYRFASDPTSAQLQADINALSSSLPAGSITGSTTYLLISTEYNITTQLVTSVLLAFSVFALLATAAIVANLVTGIVIAAQREIGIMKALGFTPLEVETLFILQIVIPAAAAAVVAIPLGTIASQPLLAQSAQALGVAYQPTFSLALDALALAGALLIATVAALLPALRAGRQKPAAIITNASAPRGRSGRTLRWLAACLYLPRPVVLGAGDAFARPLRALLTLIAVFVGVLTVTAALSLPRSFTTILNLANGNVDVVAQRSPALADADAMRIINADPQTARVVGELNQNIAVPGVGAPVNARVYRGDASRLGFPLVMGRWFTNPGEVVAPRALMHDAHLNIGDHFTVMVGSKPVNLVLVGEIYDVADLGYALFLDWSSISTVEAETAPSTYLITVTPGADVSAYVGRIAAAQPELLDVTRNDTSTIGPETAIDGVLLILAAVVIVIGVAGIFNTLLLNTRERVRDTATLKALGMSPGQVMTMVAASAALLALVGSMIGVPAGVGVNGLLLNFLNSEGGNDTPPALYEVFTIWQLVAIPLAGVAIAMVAALIPGRWAARQPVAEVLHTE